MSEKHKRGFASMDRERQREIAAKGGRAAHAQGKAHVWSRDEARAAGRKGGEAISQDRSHMSMIGRGGGESRSAMLRAERERRAQEAAAPAERAARRVSDHEVPIASAKEPTAPRLAPSRSDGGKPAVEQRAMA
jgi:uncharacterized protein